MRYAEYLPAAEVARVVDRVSERVVDVTALSAPIGSLRDRAGAAAWRRHAGE